MGTKHTPGPWEAEHSFGITTISGKLGGRSVCRKAKFAEVRSFEGHMTFAEQVEIDANAQLMVSAPKLLEALKLACARLARVDGGDSVTVSVGLEAIYAATEEEFDVEAFIAAEDSEAA